MAPRRLNRNTLAKVAAVLVFTLSAGTLVAQNPTPAPHLVSGGRRPHRPGSAKEAGRTRQLQRLRLDHLRLPRQDPRPQGLRLASHPQERCRQRSQRNPRIESVDNQIEVLPNSPNDDRIRAAVYSRIFTQPSLRKYNANQGGIRQATGPGPNVALMAGGITNSPAYRLPRHSHHRQKWQRHSLRASSTTQADSAIAGMQANATPGTFSVDNDLIVQGSATQPKAK